MSKDDDLRDFMRDDEDDDFFTEGSDVDPDSEFDFGQELFTEDLDDDGDTGTGELRQGPSRGFILLAVLLVLALIGGFAVLLFAISGGGADPLAPTRTAIAEANATTLAQAAEVDATNTAAAEITATALAASPTPSPTATATVDITATAEAIGATFTAQAELVSGTQQAVQATQAALEANQTAVAQQPNLSPDQATETAIASGQGGGEEDATPTPERVSGGLSVADVQATATRLAQLFSQPTATSAALGDTPAPGQPSPTASAGTPRATAVPGTGGPTQLPDTGLFDDLAGNPALFVLMAFGLLGVIVVAHAARNRP